MSTTRLDIDQKRAAYAFKVVSSVTEKSKKAYGSQIEKLPMMIHNSGLRNTLAFAYAKGYLKDNEEWKLVSDQIINWLAKGHTSFFISTLQKQEKDRRVASENLKILIDLGDYEYRFAMQETFALVNWLRKLVKGEDYQTQNKGGKR